MVRQIIVFVASILPEPGIINNTGGFIVGGKCTVGGIELTAATATGYPKITFHWNTTTPSAGVDLVATNAAQTGGDKTINLTKQTAAVPFKFKHVLSRANFWAKLDGSVKDSETKVFIKGVKLLGTSIEAPSAANNSSKFYTKATYKWEDGTWDYTGGTLQAAAGN